MLCNRARSCSQGCSRLRCPWLAGLSILLSVCTWSAHALHYPYAYANPYSSYPSQPALTSQHQNILRSPYNLGQITTFSKTVDTPFSSVSKSDVRVSNPGLAVPALRYAAPVVSHVAAPYAAHFAAPFAAPVAKVATAGGLLGVAYSAAPAVSHMTYTNGLGLAYAW
ncbi:Cuticle protein 76 [Eumeta japonica]|uniref:Cuticle protein 76 n=1 Tax=Eumeta variegata TaxID=151549 RepID=A0A4C2A3M4_EUMVA|nr:Cuticle protein 76 [Eumeta japonica]